jgi:Outer membrane protein beta-barrel domain
MFKRTLYLWVCALAVLASVPASASAQVVGLGPRLSFVRGDLTTATPSTRMMGGTLRIRSSKHVVLEAALDYRSEFNEDNTRRLRQTPFQASMLVFPVRSTLAPYLLGGMGIYTETIDTLSPQGIVLDTAMSRKTGWHLGAGAELFVGRHAAFFADYRFRFVKFGSPDGDDQSINIPFLDNIKFSHRGSMWTSGMAFYF